MTGDLRMRKSHHTAHIANHWQEAQLRNAFETIRVVQWWHKMNQGIRSLPPDYLAIVEHAIACE